MTRILDKFGLCITHLENVATDRSYRAKECNRIKGYLNKWKNSKMPVNLCFYLELLKPIASLSKEKIDTVSAAIALGKVKGKLLKLKNKDVNDLNQIKTMKNQIEELEHGKVEYKTICLKNLKAELKNCERKKSKEIEKIQDTINSCLEENDNKFLLGICHILNCEGWERCNAQGDIEFCDQLITHIIDRFVKPLRNTGFERAEAIEEWHDLISYAIAF